MNQRPLQILGQERAENLFLLGLRKASQVVNQGFNNSRFWESDFFGKAFKKLDEIKRQMETF